MTDHQQKQLEIIDKIEEGIKKNSLITTVVEPVDDFVNDPRLCLVGLHIVKPEIASGIVETFINPLKTIEPNFHYYMPGAQHFTIKNIRTIENPPTFTEVDVIKAQKLFAHIIPQHARFKIYFYKLLLFPNSLTLMTTTDPELDSIVLDLDQALNDAGLPDNKTYANSSHFFCNMTLARFNQTPSEAFKEKVAELSNRMHLESYTIDNVSLITGNAVLAQCNIIDEWKLL